MPLLREIERRLDRLAACANVAAAFEMAPYLKVDSVDWATCLGDEHVLFGRDNIFAAKLTSLMKS